MKRNRPPVLFKVRAVMIVLFSCVPLFGFSFSKPVSRISGSAVVTATPTPRPKARRISRPAKYSQFPHDVKAHATSCNSCHKFPSENWQKVRSGSVAFPDIAEYPKHESCIGCHRQQFFKGARPSICSICHTNPSPRNSMRHAFPNPREIFDTTAKGKTAVSDFAIDFPHDKHIEIVSSHGASAVRIETAAWSPTRKAIASAEESCSVCHQTYKPQGESADEYATKPPEKLGEDFWLKKGTFKTAPIGHTTCFTCHSADSGMLPAPTDCATCHKLKAPESYADFDAKSAAAMAVDDKIMLNAWRRRDSGKFRHEWFSHAELSCSTCHNVTAMNTADPKSTKVLIASCAACHVTATSVDGGALNFEVDSRKANAGFQCAKCHVTLGKSPIPESHLKAIDAAR